MHASLNGALVAADEAVRLAVLRAEIQRAQEPKWSAGGQPGIETLSNLWRRVSRTLVLATDSRTGLGLSGLPSLMLEG